jgi:hypothetical protein
MKFQLPSGAVLAAALIQAPPAHGESSASPHTVTIQEDVSEAATEHDFALPKDVRDSSAPLEIILPPVPEWTPKHENRFLRLAESEALGTLTSKEKSELEQLSASRYQLKTPRSGEQVVLEFQQRRATHELLQALEKYVALQKTARGSFS